LQGRKTETADKIAMRIAKAEEELGYAKDFDVVVLNDDLDTAKKEVVKIVQEFIDGLAKENIED
jgi:guanylate kinase